MGFDGVIKNADCFLRHSVYITLFLVNILCIIAIKIILSVLQRGDSIINLNSYNTVYDRLEKNEYIRVIYIPKKSFKKIDDRQSEA